MNGWGKLIAFGVIGIMVTRCVAAPQANATPAASLTPTAAVTATPTQTLLPLATSLPAPSCNETTGRVVHDRLPSALAGGNVRYRVYLPPCFDFTGKRYPMLIMLHGWVENSDVMNDDQWERLGLTAAADQGIAEGRIAPVIIVMPNGNDMDQGNDGSPYGQIIADEFLPEALRKWRAWDDPSRRAIGGLSRGGFWAFSAAFQRPGLFGKIGGHSPFLYSGEFKDFNPFDMLDTPIDIGKPEIAIDHGAQDYVRDNARIFVQKLQARRADVTYVVHPEGSHVEAYWAAHVAEYLDFYTAGWPLNVVTYPNADN